MPPELRTRAAAKLNLGLRVAAAGRAGLHPIRSLMQTVSWHDWLALWEAEATSFVVGGSSAGLPAQDDNLAWRALQMVRATNQQDRPLGLRLEKHIPISAGLGGGSADAAAVLRLGTELLGGGDLGTAAHELGSDVPFALIGGCAVVEKTGEQVSSVAPMPAGYAVGIVVPPPWLSAGAVYLAWDRLGGPCGRDFPDDALPPSLRQFAPLGNDLEPAAVSLSPELGDWSQELAARWGRPVALTGSGPALFGFFLDLDEAEAALSAAPSGARASHAAVPVGLSPLVVADTL